MAKQIIVSEELAKKIVDHLSPIYGQCKNDRETLIDPLYKLADDMYQGRQTSTEEPAERLKGMNTTWTTRAKPGSTTFHRGCNQFAAIATRIVNSQDIPFKYVPVTNDAVFNSSEDGFAMAEQYNAVARWVWSKDKMREKVFPMFVALAKYTNVPLVSYMHDERRRVAMPSQEGKATFKELRMLWPSIGVMPWDSVYGDMYGGDIQTQRAVFVEAVLPLHVLMARTKTFQAEQWAKFLEDPVKYQWDAATGTDPKKDRASNLGDDYSPSSDGKYMLRETYAWMPIEGGAWKDEGVESLSLCRVRTIGNDISSAIIVGLDQDFDPHGEIPMLMLHSKPDDDDKLYHASTAGLCRSLYSIKCSLMGMLCDNVANRNNPKRLVNRLMCEVENMDTEDVWPCNGNVEGVVKEFAPQDATSVLLPAMDAVDNEWMLAMNLYPNAIGQSFGGRTPATEILNIKNQAQAPQLFQIGYAVEQFLRWYATKLKGHIDADLPKDMVIAISDEAGKMQQISLKDLYGDFDVDVSIVSEFQDNEILANKMIEMIRSVGQSPALMQSDSHQVDIGEMLKDAMRWMGLPSSSKYILPPQGIDARTRQKEEIVRMMPVSEGGNDESIEPQANENHKLHIAECDAVILQWKPLLGDPSASWVEDRLIPHRETHLLMMEQGSSQSVSQGGGTLEAPSTAQTPGQLVGAEQLAGAMGGGV
jgi:hypothetical protein